MLEFLFIVILILPIIISVKLNITFENTYGKPAIQTGPCILQCIAIAAANLTRYNSDFGFVISVAATVASYVLAFIYCRKNAMEVGATKADLWKAILAQFLLPLGAVIVIFAALLFLLGGGDSDSKKKK